jgi:transposase/predicted nucleic acid-binding Zn finger protein
MNEQQLLVRQQRGYDIFQRYTIKQQGKVWLVPSTAPKNKIGKYVVDLTNCTCTCPDYETRKGKCKHLFAVEFYDNAQFLKAIDGDIQTDNIPQEVKELPKKKTYSQPNWSAYHQSQVSEKAQFKYLLHELCKGVETPMQENGRPRINLADLLFSMVYKVYTCFSSRRFMSDLHDAVEKQYLTKSLHYNSIVNGFSLGEATPILKQLIETSSLPLTAIEKDFAVDSTGLSTCRFYRWHHAKYSDKRLIDKRDWQKVHLICGVKTNIVTAVEITHRFAGDSPQFKPLVDKTALRFKINEVSGDKAYLSEKNLITVLDYGGMPYIQFKANSTDKTSYHGMVWKNMYHYYSLNQERFLEHYHKRSNVETTFSMIKGKFGDSLRSKTELAQINEALCKVLAHNICVLITSIYELGLKPKFWNKI